MLGRLIYWYKSEVKLMTVQKMKDDVFMLQVRLFRLAQQEWGLSASECDELFAEYDINTYIESCYEEFHVQGDDANLENIKTYIDNRRVKNAFKK